MTDVLCPDCLLTPSGGRLLTSATRDLEAARPDDPTWRVEHCDTCGRPSSIHDDLDGWTFGDVSLEDEPATPTFLNDAPEWITVSEAAYGARVSESLILEWAHSGLLECVALFPGSERLGVLVRTADVRASLVSGATASVPVATQRPVEPSSEADALPVSGWSVNRRKVLVGLGMAVSGALIPVRAIAGGGPRLATETAAIDPLVVALGKGTVNDAKGSGKGSGGKGSGGQGGHGGHGGGTTTSIQSVTVQPNPVVSGGTATITIGASPRRRIVSYGITASEGILTQDPASPWIWVWRAA